MAKPTGRQPDYNVSAMDKNDNDGRLKGVVGVAWIQDTGAIQIKLNPFVVLDTTKHDILISLFPRDPNYKAKPNVRAAQHQGELLPELPPDEVPY